MTQKFVESLSNKSVEEIWCQLKTKLVALRDLFVPITKASAKLWQEKGNFPIDKDAREAIKYKNKKHRFWMESKKNGSSERAQSEYTKARNKVKSLLRKAKRKFEKGIALKSKTNPKMTQGES